MAPLLAYDGVRITDPSLIIIIYMYLEGTCTSRAHTYSIADNNTFCQVTLHFQHKSFAKRCGITGLEAFSFSKWGLVLKIAQRLLWPKGMIKQFSGLYGPWSFLRAIQ